MQLVLGDDAAWDELNTVIALEVSHGEHSLEWKREPKMVSRWVDAMSEEETR